MKKNLFVIVACLLFTAHGVAQAVVKFEVDGQPYSCSNPNPLGSGTYYSYNGINLEFSNISGAQCAIVTLQLQIHNFTGPGNYSLNLNSGNYGYYNETSTPPAWESPVYSGDPGGGSVNVTRFDSTLGILEGTFSMVLSKHMFDTTNTTTVSITKGYFSFGTCYATFNLVQDTIPHHWLLLYNAAGVQPIGLTFYWGDGTSSGPNTTHVYSSAGNYDICLAMTDNAGCTSTYCDSNAYVYKTEDIISVSIADELATGIGNINGEQASFTLSPNPTTNSVNITMPKELIGKSITLIDITGRKLATIQPENLNAHLETSPLAAGVYFVTIGNATKKLVVAK